MPKPNNRRIGFDHKTSNPNVVLAIGLSYEKPDKSYWNPDEPTAPYYRFTVIPTKVEYYALAGGLPGKIASREIVLYGGGGRKWTIHNAPMRFNERQLKEKYADMVKNDPIAKGMIDSVLASQGLTLTTDEPMPRE
jgi:hypothetical protein